MTPRWSTRPNVWLMLLVVVLTSTGCGGERRPYVAAIANSNFSYNTAPSLPQISRVVVVPTWLAGDVGRSGRSLDQTMPAAIRDLGRFDVVTTTIAERDALIGVDVLQRGEIPLEALIAVREAYRADALLVLRCDQFSSYDPVSVSVQAAMMSCYDGSRLWQASGLFDGATKTVQQDIRAWYEGARGVALEDIAGWRGTLHSPRLFARYVSDRLAGSVLAPPPPPRPHQPLVVRQTPGSR